MRIIKFVESESLVRQWWTYLPDFVQAGFQLTIVANDLSRGPYNRQGEISEVRSLRLPERQGRPLEP